MPYEDKYESPDMKPNHAGGVPTLHEASEAQERCDERRKWQDNHPGEMSSGPDDWQQRSKDYEAIEAGDKMMRFGGGGTVEPGDAFCAEKDE